MTKEIKLEKIKDAMELVDRASKIDGDVWLSNKNGCKVSGKSILGVFDVAVDSDMSVEYPDANADFDEFLNRLEIKALGYMPNQR